MQIINGHSVVRFYSVPDCWVVDGRFTYYDLRSLANGLGLTVEALKEVLENG